MYLPIWFKGTELNCLVIGGGKIASHKIDLLVKVGASVTVIAPEAHGNCEKLIQAYNLNHIKREFRDEDCRGFSLIIAATQNKDVNRIIAKEAKNLGIPVNVIDDPELCTVIFSASHSEGDLSIAVSTSGKAPFLAASMRDRIEGITEHWGEWVHAGSIFRSLLMSLNLNEHEMKKFLKLFSDIKPKKLDSFPTAEDSLDVWLNWIKQLADDDK